MLQPLLRLFHRRAPELRQFGSQFHSCAFDGPLKHCQVPLALFATDLRACPLSGNAADLPPPHRRQDRTASRQDPACRHASGDRQDGPGEQECGTARLFFRVSVAVASVSRMVVNSTRMRSAAAALLDRRRCSSLRDATLSSVARSTPGSLVSAFVPFSMARTCWSRRRMAVVTSSPPPPTIRPSSLAMLLI